MLAVTENLLSIVSNNNLTIKSWTEYESVLLQIKDAYSEFEAESYSTPCGPDTTKFRASVSGNISVRKKHTHHGGYYGFTRYLPVALTVGSAVDSEIRKEIAEIMEVVTDKAKDVLSCGDKKGFSMNKDGTNFCTMGLAFAVEYKY